mmetsp:Transcript_10301/g.30373  ORF Transcript_10301/g.30373 Transcript_10301/m.30373 type:complete len:350 (-) Transcript_10301:119-1168(-)
MLRDVNMPHGHVAAVVLAGPPQVVHPPREAFVRAILSTVPTADGVFRALVIFERILFRRRGRPTRILFPRSLFRSSILPLLLFFPLTDGPPLGGAVVHVARPKLVPIIEPPHDRIFLPIHHILPRKTARLQYHGRYFGGRLIQLDGVNAQRLAQVYAEDEYRSLRRSDDVLSHLPHLSSRLDVGLSKAEGYGPLPPVDVIDVDPAAGRRTPPIAVRARARPHLIQQPYPGDAVRGQQLRKEHGCQSEAGAQVDDRRLPRRRRCRRPLVVVAVVVAPAIISPDDGPVGLSRGRRLQPLGRVPQARLGLVQLLRRPLLDPSPRRRFEVAVPPLEYPQPFRAEVAIAFPDGK